MCQCDFSHKSLSILAKKLLNAYQRDLFSLEGTDPSKSITVVSFRICQKNPIFDHAHTPSHPFFSNNRLGKGERVDLQKTVSRPGSSAFQSILSLPPFFFHSRPHLKQQQQQQQQLWQSPPAVQVVAKNKKREGGGGCMHAMVFEYVCIAKVVCVRISREFILETACMQEVFE